MANLEDPFYGVQGEVLKALATVNQLYNRWKELLDNTNIVGKEEYTWTTSEIKNNIRSIEWDLEDLTETIGIVESNPMKFSLTAMDVMDRHEFIKDTRQTINSIKKHIISPETKGKVEKGNRNSLLTKTYNGNKYARLDNELVQSNQRFIEDQSQQQQVLMTQQDEQLVHVGHSVGVLKDMGKQIGGELDCQAVILEDLNHEIEQTDSKLQTVLVRVEKMLKLADDKKQTYVLVSLIIMCLVVIVLFVAL